MAAERPRIHGALSRAASLRMRIALAAVLVVGLALGVGAVLLLGTLRANLLDYGRTTAEQRANSVATQIARGAGDQLPPLDKIDDDESVQIVSADGTVLAATKNAQGLPDLRTSESASEVRDVSFDDHPIVLVHKTVTRADQQLTVVVGRDLEQRQDATASVFTVLVIGCPALLLIVGAMAWFAVGGALAPVDRIRVEAEEIRATELHRRVPEPARQDEIGRLARTMNRMLDRLETSQRQQRRFISDAAHELRSPIAAIKQNIEVATTYPDAITTAELTAVVSAESTRLERLTADLLRLARLDERAPEPSGNPVDLDDLVLDQVQRLRSTTALRIESGGVSAGRVGGDEALLSQVLRNLVDNAERHTSTAIAFTLGEEGEAVRLSVEDDGPGIAVTDRERIFDRFVRLDEARTHDGGTGLGLAIVREVVTAYGGGVTVTASDLGGACFTIRLPRLVDSA